MVILVDVKKTYSEIVEERREKILFLSILFCPFVSLEKSEATKNLIKKRRYKNMPIGVIKLNKKGNNGTIILDSKTGAELKKIKEYNSDHAGE